MDTQAWAHLYMLQCICAHSGTLVHTSTCSGMHLHMLGHTHKCSNTPGHGCTLQDAWMHSHTLRHTCTHIQAQVCSQTLEHAWVCSQVLGALTHTWARACAHAYCQLPHARVCTHTHPHVLQHVYARLCTFACAQAWQGTLVHVLACLHVLGHTDALSSTLVYTHAWARSCTFGCAHACFHMLGHTHTCLGVLAHAQRCWRTLRHTCTCFINICTPLCTLGDTHVSLACSHT